MKGVYAAKAASRVEAAIQKRRAAEPSATTAAEAGEGDDAMDLLPSPVDDQQEKELEVEGEAEGQGKEEEETRRGRRSGRRRRRRRRTSIYVCMCAEKEEENGEEPRRRPANTLPHSLLLQDDEDGDSNRAESGRQMLPFFYSLSSLFINPIYIILPYIIHIILFFRNSVGC